jgi:hypothetical protein
VPITRNDICEIVSVSNTSKPDGNPSKVLKIVKSPSDGGIGVYSLSNVRTIWRVASAIVNVYGNAAGLPSIFTARLNPGTLLLISEIVYSPRVKLVKVAPAMAWLAVMVSENPPGPVRRI